MSKIQKRKGEFMEELKNTDKKSISTKRKIGKTTYEVVVHFDENATETMQDKLTRIMLRELRRKSNEKKDDFD
ncbi:transposon-encoded TnpW family protein [Abiotrophia sp.]|uniref:transposon-encoded TnpW family protein n=1 Tax=Abiotrophia sp. TaxID=76631 RepID=UPI0025C68A4C|nr:transposon-encoded TnpW family protein [Abiotrophia sp.]